MKRLLVLSLALAGCIDFVEPELPELGAPAVIQAAIRVTDRGEAGIEAVLVPGLDRAGFKRNVPSDTLFALGRAIGSDSIARNGSRHYRDAWQASAGATAEPVTFRAPFLADLSGSPPELTWTGARRVGPDTLSLVRGDDLFLEIAEGEGISLPEPELQQWFLRLEGEDRAFNISADGLPPDTIQIPARWIPAGREVAARLIFAQSAVLDDGPGDYVGLITLDIRLHWTLQFVDPPAGARQ